MSATAVRPRCAAPAPGPGQRRSALYVGTVRHRRAEPANAFTHPVSLAYVDLDELPSLLDGALLRPGPRLVRFDRRDYLGDSSRPLAEAVRDRAEQLTGERPDGPIRLLTQLRSFGMCFNPVSFYYCFAAGGDRLRTVLAEVTNTPWGERHAYALDDPRDPGGRVIAGRFDKRLHVSPFMEMDHRYEARATRPGETLSVHIANHARGETVFDATLKLRRRPFTRSELTRMTARHPFAVGRVLALIYGHALHLKLRGARYVPHPRARR